ncbi:MAG TPA: elongation factor G [Candidatus Acetatifactor stercoripullorum]|uniref:Elongation factor G n=1 Tax=Candidatus Acetatifactor stercoripullorum TaxID=2838414 RepID=A0A9D1R436_9FIRM|nr:elongation factor G [uncultured Acetatifactor sp.]HIW80495.1 elongation factor G [Candidatus Acetatifactor stercoripullorum]
MNVYTTEKIRNVVLLGHGGSGKTSLAEAMAYLSGITSRMGRVADGNTVSDYSKEEQKRKFSISTSVIPIEWEGYKINVIDAPGYFDFVGEMEEAVSAAGAAIIVVNGKSGIEVGTEKAWELCEKYKLPRFVYVSNMDVDNASFRQVVEDMTSLYGKKIAPFHLPIRENEKFVGYINVITEAGNRWQGKEVIPCEVPEYNKANLQICRDTLMEAVAETSEEFMERYFGGETFSEAEIRAALRTNVCDGSIVPMTMGSNTLCQGVYTLLDDIIKYMPSPENREVAGINMKTNEIFHADYDFSKAKSAVIWKTIVDPFMGKYSLIKVNSGVFKTDDLIYNVDKDIEEKIGKLYVLQGNKPIEVKELHAGDLGALAKLTAARTGNSLSTKATPIKFGKFEISTPYTYMRYQPKNKGDVDKISQALQKMTHEDLTLKAVNDSENRQMLLYGMGDQHLEIVVSRLLNEYKVEVELTKPKIAYRETIKKQSDVEYKYKKQSGGHGQYGHVKMRFSPSGDLTTPFVFEQEVVGGAVPKNFFPAVEKGLQESVIKGPMAAYPVVGVKAVLYDGSYHPVDSSEMAFKMATIQAFKKGFMEAQPVLLEPIASLKVTVPDSYTGDIMGDLNKRRGRVLGMNPVAGGKQTIEADIPMSGLFGYCTDLRSMTGGRGEYSYEFSRYEQAPSDVQEREVAARAAKVAENSGED